MKTLIPILLLSTFGFAQAADLAALATAAGGTYDAAAHAVVIKNNRDLTAAQLAALADAGGVKSLTLSGCKLGSDGVAVLPKFQGLGTLELGHTMVNKVADLKVLAGLASLEELSLGGSDFGDEGLAAVCTLKNLRVLMLGHVGRSDKTAFTAEGLKALTKLPKLEDLTLHFHKPDAAMIPVLASLKTVKNFAVGGVSSDYLGKVKAAMPQAKVASRGPTTDAVKK